MLNGVSDARGSYLARFQGVAPPLPDRVGGSGRRFRRRSPSLFRGFVCRGRCGGAGSLLAGVPAKMLANASIVRTHWLQPPGFGFEGTMRVPFPRSDRPRVGTHFQHVLHIEGSVPHEFADYHLRVDVHVRGALWRSQTHTLCTSLDPNPEHETRHCEAGSGTFAAHVWAFVPASRPWSPLGSGAVGVSSSNSLAAAATPAAATPALVPAGVSTAARGAGTGRLPYSYVFHHQCDPETQC